MFSAVGLILLSPLLLIIYILIVVESKGGGFYKQERIGQGEKPFYIIKFRTMRKDSDKVSQITVGGHDPRITKLGYYLRKYKVDELPQLWNVLKGDMSLVGPRPEVPKYVALYTKEQRRVLSVRPGITDWASIEYVDENDILGKAEEPDKAYIEQIIPDKIRYNMRWVEKQGLKEYFKIIFTTFCRIIHKSHNKTPIVEHDYEEGVVHIHMAGKDDVKGIVDIHKEAFQGFFLTQLGDRFLKLYYRSMCDYEGALTLCAIDGNKIVGFSSTALRSSGFNGRLIKSHLLGFGFEGLLLLFSRPKALLHLVKNFEKKADDIGDEGLYAELFSIGVSQKFQGRGVGSMLLNETEKSLSAIVEQISLTTDKNDNDATNTFYRKNDYEVLYEFTAYPNREMYRYIKTLNNKRKEA